VTHTRDKPHDKLFTSKNFPKIKDDPYKILTVFLIASISIDPCTILLHKFSRKRERFARESFCTELEVFENFLGFENGHHATLYVQRFNLITIELSYF